EAEPNGSIALVVLIEAKQISQVIADRDQREEFSLGTAVSGAAPRSEIPAPAGHRAVMANGEHKASGVRRPEVVPETGL
ncbi:MAG: hypothetical protein JRJ87_27655, partial [Deltaproteobacteria bacterium]|nr:hypothetical protein [Deltaproteobacteria bacterium]